MRTMSLYDAIAQSSLGRRHLAKARLRYRILSVLHEALEIAGITQNELASRADVTKSAVSQALAGNGNLRADTVATYLDAMGFELRVELASAGAAREEAMNWVSGPVLRGALPKSAACAPALDAASWGETHSFELRSDSRVLVGLGAAL